MHEQRRRPERGDIHGPSHGDFTDWNNPEDEYEDDEGYAETHEADWREDGEDDEDDDSYVPEPDDPDYDLSEAAGYAGWESQRREGPLPRWVIVLFSIILILAILTPVLIRVR